MCCCTGGRGVTCHSGRFPRVHREGGALRAEMGTCAHRDRVDHDRECARMPSTPHNLHSDVTCSTCLRQPLAVSLLRSAVCLYSVCIRVCPSSPLLVESLYVAVVGVLSLSHDTSTEYYYVQSAFYSISITSCNVEQVRRCGGAEWRPTRYRPLLHASHPYGTDYSTS